MKHRYHCFVLCLLSMVMVGSPAIGDKIITTFTFGKIETLKTGEVEWTFLGKDSELAETDLVRMPPRSFIRLKDAHGTLLDTLPGSRELRVRDLIREGRERRQTNKETKRINGNSDKRPATDVLPLGNRPEADKATKSTKTSHRLKVTASELTQLRGQLDALPEEIVREVAIYAFWNNASTHVAIRKDVRMDGYPNPTLQMAKTLYDNLNRLESPNGWSRERAQKTSVIDNRALLYAQLLRHLNIGADLAVNEANELLVIFDSKIPLAQAKHITANQSLIYKKQTKNTVWLSILVQPQKQNFITAWYEGSRMQLVQD